MAAQSTNDITALNPNSADDITLALARMAIDTPQDDIPASAFAAAQVAAMDALGCAFAGHDAPGVESVVELTTHWGGRPEATVWFQNARAPAPAAALANSVQLHALDFDDYHPPSGAHITSVLVPAVLAAGEMNDSTGKETLAALILGVEVVGRLGRACQARRDHEGFLPASVICGFGATAAVCRLQEASVDETVNAIGIWYAHASGNRQALFDRTLTKRIQPGIAARDAVFAACLAAKDFSGPRRIIGDQPASLTRIYGFTGAARGVNSPPTVGEVMAERNTWTIEELEYKRFCTCGVSGPGIVAAISLAKEHGLVPEEIDTMRLFVPNIHSPFGAVPWGDHATPQVLAQFCVPYAVASAIRNRRYGPDEIAPARIAQDSEVDRLARGTQLCSWTDWKGDRPDAKTVLQAFLKDGRMVQSTDSDHRRYRSPHDDDALVEKFFHNVQFSDLVNAEETRDCLGALQTLEHYPDVALFIRRWLT
ncbi:MAG: hypothetical protein HN742_32775 [Lentisphaerae bacterium]|jgi:2-methylcitrate dehydratase PrpD|nr:hypothetical protein [Lentisphaerota bacterium]MBT4822591.1 hypothetical protein [Lentisphaerota bacterium]MBT5610917.1 hypothetical protein [Lentisphaerota bacterium]MBT7055914.1 hypothetical protein [Lentisphaerota bacterium]MBT7846691.1 hypothetical protein [Lentisphaerota bacterium]